MKTCFTPRDYQKIAIEFLLSHKRGNLFMSPGMGKTASVLSALSIFKMLGEDDVFPVLVLGPKKVANTVWDAEAEVWGDFNNIKVSKILGNPEERKAALRKRADVYTINYENAYWLIALFGTGFPFKTIICDESTKIRGHRVSVAKKLNKDGGVSIRGGRVKKDGKMTGGTKNATALVRRSFDVPRWYNLTGTPTPKGLMDLWAQMFPIDHGKALEPSYTAFMQMYYNAVIGSDAKRPVYEIKEYSEKQITEAIKPHSLMLDAYDWFDVDKPMEIDDVIELPPKLQKQYNELHKESVLKLDDGNFIETKVVSMKCRQFASGNVLDEDGVAHHIHDLKLDAVEDRIESLNGANVIIAYHFRSDLAALQKRFPKGVLLPSDPVKQKQVEKDWNAGKIDILFLHPQSAGHGLNLQYGGNHMIIYTPDWNAEYYEQVIERIGPVRQAQAGFKRLTYIYRIVVKKTWDVVVLANLKKKFQTSAQIKTALAEV